MQARHDDGSLQRRPTRHGVWPGTWKAQSMVMTDDGDPATEPGARAGISRLLQAGLVIGLSIGLGWSSVVEMFSGDNEFDLTELGISLSVPVVVAIVVGRVFRTGIGFAVTVAFLTLLIPLFGIGMGGANVLQMTIGGSIGGVFWSLPFVAWRLAMKRWGGFKPIGRDAELAGTSFERVESSGGDLS